MNTNNIKAIIFDMDGVIWRSKVPIGTPERSFALLQEKGIKFAFVTNNSTKTIDTYYSLLNKMGIEVTNEQIYTSAKATAQYLKKMYPKGGNVFVVGMPGLADTLKQYGFSNSSSEPLAVVVGMDETINYDKLKTATLLIRNGVPFVGTNPDKTFPSPEGLLPGAGSMLAAIEASTDTTPKIIGKPKSTMFEQALEYLNQKAENVLVVGDRLETDIAGGQAAGCKTALVLTGVATKESGQNWKPAVDIISPDLETLMMELDLK